MGAIVVNLTLIVRVIVLSTGTFFFSSFSIFPAGVNSGTSEDVDPVAEIDAVLESVSLGGVFSNNSVEVSASLAEELPTKRSLIFPGTYTMHKLCEKDHGSSPEILSSLISPNATALDTLTKPDSESVRVAFTTGSTTPSSVRLAIASATPTISASSIRVGKPLNIVVNLTLVIEDRALT